MTHDAYRAKAHRVGLIRRGIRWLGPAAVVAAAPKCALCVLAYVGLGTTLGLGRHLEICGAPGRPPDHWWFAVLVGLMGVGGGCAVKMRNSKRKRKIPRFGNEVLRRAGETSSSQALRA